MAASVASTYTPDVFISRATIELKRPPTVVPQRIYEWHTQVIGAQTELPPVSQQAEETPVECIKQQKSASTATPKYTLPSIHGNVTSKRNLAQTLDNFFETERQHSAWNRVSK